MKNLKELCERYKNEPNGLGSIAWGGKEYYEINSDIPLELNADSSGFILNDEGQVELFDLNKREIVKRHYYIDEEWDNEVDYETEYFWDETEPVTWWGKTLDNYYPWSYFPEKEIKAFQIMKRIPLFKIGDVVEVDEDGVVRSDEDYEVSYWAGQCLDNPEFFKPLYD